MDFLFSPQEEAFQEEFSSWLEKNLPAGWDPKRHRRYVDDLADQWGPAYRDFQRRLFDAGYAGLHYPRAYGGQGRSLMEEVIVLEVTGSRCVELRLPGIINMSMAGPIIHTHGTEEQKREFIPKLLNGTHIWCQGFSEPDAGSDVANVSTQAIKENGHYIVHGQKVWTSFAHLADYCILLVRTDPDSTKHHGLSYLLLDMKLPGIEVRPIKMITGEAEFNEVFFNDVRVPLEMLLGKEGKGWQIAINTLMFERVMGDAIFAAMSEKNIKNLIEIACQTKRSGKPIIHDPVFRQKLAQAYIEILVLKYHGLRSLSNQIKGGVPGPEGSISKLLWSEPNQRLCETAMDIQGLHSQILGRTVHAIQSGDWQYEFLRSKGNSIEAGTSEIQRNIIAERVLGLPKDLSRSKKA